MSDGKANDITPSFKGSLYKLQLQDSLTCIDMLSSNPSGKTEKVVDQSGTFYVRKYVPKSPHALATAAQLMSVETPVLPRILTFYTFGNEIVLIIEYIEGVTLRRYIEERGPLTVNETLQLLSDVFDGLETLHSMSPEPIVHRDINPNNIIVNNGCARIVDFGISRTFSKESVQDTQHWGTKGYVSPEQVGFGKSSPQSDIYSLAATVLFCLTGNDPQTNIEATLSQSKLPQTIQSTIRHATELSCDKRIQSIGDFASELKQTEDEQHTIKPYQASNNAENTLKPPQDTTRVIIPKSERAFNEQTHQFIVHSPLNYVWKGCVGLFYLILFGSSIISCQKAASLDQEVFLIYTVQLLIVDLLLILPFSTAIAFLPEFIKKQGVFSSKRVLVMAAFLASSVLITFIIFFILYFTVDQSILQEVTAYNNSLAT